MPPSSRITSNAFALALLGMLISVSCLAEETVTFKALSFPRQQENSSIELLIGDEEVIEIPLHAHEFTLPLKAPRRSEWQFGKSSRDAEGNFTFKTHATVAPLSAPRQLLIFIRKGPKNEDGFRIIPLNPGQIRGRNYVVLNLTQGPISGVAGGQRFRIPPGRRVVVMPEADRGENLCFATLRYQRNEKWRPFFSSNWKLRKNSRSLIFVYQTQGQRAPRIHSVVDPL